MNKALQKEIQTIPKIILHLHLDGSLRPETVKEWEKEEGHNLTLEDVVSKLTVEPNCKDLNEYLEKFDLPLHFLQTKEHIERATYELFEDLSKQNVIYAEVRFAPSLHRKKGLTYPIIVQSAIRGMERAKKEFGIDGNLILCCMRGNDEKNTEDNLATLAIAKKFIGLGVCAVDLAGAEALFSTDKFEEIFKLAKNKDINFTIHAGEAAGPESIKKAIEFGTTRIGHGIRSIQDPHLMDELRRLGITLEICPISNLQTQAIQGEYPLEKLYRSGILTTINTDNNTVSGTNINNEYSWILEHTNLSLSDLMQMNVNAARASFTSPQKKATLVNIIKNSKANNIQCSEKSY